MDDFQKTFETFDGYAPLRLGFAGAIDHAMAVIAESSKLAYHQALVDGTVCDGCHTAFRDLQPTIRLERGERLCRPCLAQQPKLAEFGQPEAATSPVTQALRYLGAIGQVWEAPELGIPQKPSSLGQLLLLGSLGAATGYGAGKLLNKLAPNEYVDFSVPSTLAGLAVGATPGLTSAALNNLAGRPVWSESFWNAPDMPKKTAEIIPVDKFQQVVWGDMSVASRLPPTIQAAASGLVQGAAHLPGKPPNSLFVTPGDVAKMAVGLGGGALSGYIFGKTIGNVFGLTPKAQRVIIGSGAFAGLLKTLTPRVYGEGN